jgi:(E)-4-hydroxy-3-methyl-but-2-enyl pyrophosphate reductase
VVAAELGIGIALAVAAAEPWQSHARSVVDDWLSVAGARTILLPSPRSFCAGVERAIKAVEQALEQHGAPVYVRRQIVHNKRVVADLEARGAVFVDELDQVPGGATVVFSPHGVSPAVRREASDRGLAVIDATCPLVKKVHAEARRFAGLGGTVVLIGHAGSDEVVGIAGEAPQATVVIKDSADVAKLKVPDPANVSYSTQTTLAVDETADTVAALRRRFPLCCAGHRLTTSATRPRTGSALAAVAADAGLVLVVGSANSSSSSLLVELARRHGTPAHLIDGAADIRADWLTAARTIALTAGASAPPVLVDAVIDALRGLGPVEVIEREGYRPAESHDQDRMHAVGVIDAATGRPSPSAQPSWTEVFADEITAIGAERPDVVAITAAMLHPTGLGRFADRFPDRIFDVGIAEQHAVTSAAGLAMAGLHPVVAVYPTFLSRACDQVLMDVALHRLPVTFVLDRAGITGPDGPSHHGMRDASWLPMVPGLRMAAPRDPGQLRALLREAVQTASGPTAIRCPKATAEPDILAVRRIGDLDVLCEDPDAQVLLIAVGSMAAQCLAAAEELAAGLGLPVTVIDPRWTAPLDPALITMCMKPRLVLAVEDSTITGSVGSRIAAAVAAAGAPVQVASLALPASFLPHDSREQLLRRYGLDATGLRAAVRDRLQAPTLVV